MEQSYLAEKSFAKYRDQLLTDENVQQAIQERENYYKLQQYKQKFDYWRAEADQKFKHQQRLL